MLRRISAMCVVLAVVSATILVSQAQAGVITDVSASASSIILGDEANYGAINAVNGNGLIGDNHSINQAVDTWTSGMGLYAIGQYITIDLKKDYVLPASNTLRVWNYNQNGNDPEHPEFYMFRGMKLATFSYLADDGGAVLTGTTQPSGTFTTLAGVTTDAAEGVTFDMANGSDTATNSNYVSFNQSITARYIRITCDYDWASDYEGYENFVVGLSEVQVNAVPEPSTFVLLAAGLLGLLAYAWRKRK